MPINMGNVDRGLRILFALAVVGFYLTGQIGGTVALVLGIVALALVGTAIAGRCPTYTLFGLSTVEKTEARTPR